jgi:hypothetical protein
LLRIRVIVNNKKIYPITAGERIVIEIEKNNPTIVVTDGFHFTRPLELIFHHIHTYNFHIVCAIGNEQLLAGCFSFILLYLAGFASGWFILKLLSFFPVAYILFLYYINRKEFIQLKTV